MTCPSARLSDRLMSIAAFIAPAHRQAWIEAMRAELGPAGGARLGWASGCLLTAIGQRIACATLGAGGRFALGLALILLGCGWAIHEITSGMPYSSWLHSAYEIVDMTYWLAVTQSGVALIAFRLGDRPARLGRRTFGLASALFAVAGVIVAAITPSWAGLSGLFSFGFFAILALALLLDSRKLLPLFPLMGIALLAIAAWETLGVMAKGITGWPLVWFILLFAPPPVMLAIARALILGAAPRLQDGVAPA